MSFTAGILSTLWKPLELALINGFLHDPIVAHLESKMCPTLCNKNTEVDCTIRAASTTTQSINMIQWLRSTQAQVPSSANWRPPDTFPLPTDVLCWVDGSFQKMDAGGTAYICTCCGRLIQYALACSTASTPFHMEATALFLAVQPVSTLQVRACTFYTDCQTLVQSFRSHDAMQNTDRQAYHTLLRIAQLLAANPQYRCMFIPHKENNQANQLANLARRS